MTKTDDAGRVHQVMAGFIVWLSTQRVPTLRRARLHQSTARYLRWRAHTPQAILEEPSFGEWRYYSWLRLLGADEDELAAAREALALLRRYRAKDVLSAVVEAPVGPGPAADDQRGKGTWSQII
jgi:hypothetical protein